MKRYIYKGLQYAIMIEGGIIFAVIISALPITPLRFIVRDRTTEKIIFASLGFLVELISLCLVFLYERLASKKATSKQFALPLLIGFPVQFLLAWWNGFYMYTGGVAVSETGMLWQGATQQEQVLSPDGVATWRFLILFGVMTVFRVASVFLGYHLGNKNIQKGE